MNLRKNISGYYDSKSFLQNQSLRKFYLDSSNLPSEIDLNGNPVLIPPECDHRIDLFSYQQYGTSRLWWLIAMANADQIRDPIWDFTSGQYVIVPKNSALTRST